VRHLAADHGRAEWTIKGPSGAGPFRYDRTFELIAGLFGAPNRRLVLDEMERRKASGQPVSPAFDEALDLLRKVR